MTTDAPLFDLAPLADVDHAPDATIAERFEDFHRANPHVADALEALAAQWLAHHQKVSAKALMERLRWESGIQTAGDVWRLNNSYTSRYARLLVDRNPEWEAAIETRELRAA